MHWQCLACWPFYPRFSEMSRTPQARAAASLTDQHNPEVKHRASLRTLGAPGFFYPAVHPLRHRADCPRRDLFAAPAHTRGFAASRSARRRECAHCAGSPSAKKFFATRLSSWIHSCRHREQRADHFPNTTSDTLWVANRKLGPIAPQIRPAILEPHAGSAGVWWIIFYDFRYRNLALII